MPSRWTRALALVAITFVVSSCGSEGDGGGPDAGPRERTRRPGPTRATCPDGSTLTYETFGRELLERWCVRCHSSELTTAAEREGAPLGIDFDGVERVRAHREAIDSVAAAGPARVNLYMPIGSEQPTDEERERLGEWLACGAP